MILQVADYISAGPLAIYFYLIYSFLSNPYKNLFDIILGFYILGSDLLVNKIKGIKYPKKLYNITRRPKEALNCDILSQKGKPKEGTPGFPSGHMTTISLFAIVMILGKYEIYKRRGFNFLHYMRKEPFFILVNILIVILTAWARYYKNCHNITQILGGIIFGSTLGIIFVTLFIKKNILGIKKLN